ncbi:MAG: PrsW family intramembrane metalloprotease [Treponema sp.]|nr:PrsW family intramembrane metalloprotease [Treponema sp.]
MWTLLLLISISTLPVIGVFIWFRLVRYPVDLFLFFCGLLGGALALLVAGFFQSLFPPLNNLDLQSLLFRLIVQIALTEEAGRLMILLILRLVLDRFVKAPALPAENLGSALGLLTGLGFAVIETATYGAADLRIALLRAFTAAPLHGACGSRVGVAVFSFREAPFRGVFRFIAAAVIHGVYNFMVINPEMPIVFPILLVAASLLSALQTIRPRNSADNPG